MDKRVIHWWNGYVQTDYDYVKDGSDPRTIYALYADYGHEGAGSRMSIEYDELCGFALDDLDIYMIEYHLTSYVDSIGLKEVELLSSLFRSEDDVNLKLAFDILKNLK